MDYFADLFGQPDVTRRENWDGKEEPLKSFTLTGRRGNILHMVAPDDVAAYEEHFRQQHYRQMQNTIDIDHEIVD